MEKQAKNPVHTTAKTLRLIEILKQFQSAGVTKLASELNMGKSAVHNHLSTLEEAGYVVKHGDEYKLGLKFLELGGLSRIRMEVFKITEPKLNDLARRSDELCNLMVEERGLGVYLYRAKGDEAVDVDTYVGRQGYLHNTALGKAILAHYPRERVEGIIDTHGLPAETEDSITDEEELFDELRTVREQGYAIDDEERLKGLRCVAAPMLNSQNEVLGSISISAPKSRMKRDRLEGEIASLVQDTTNVIELNINYS